MEAMDIGGGVAGAGNGTESDIVEIVCGSLGSKVSLALRLLQLSISLGIVVTMPAIVPNAFTSTSFVYMFSIAIVQLGWSIFMVGFDVHSHVRVLTYWNRNVVLFSFFVDMILNHVSFFGTCGAGTVSLNLGYEIHYCNKNPCGLLHLVVGMGVLLYLSTLVSTYLNCRSL